MCVCVFFTGGECSCAGSPALLYALSSAVVLLLLLLLLVILVVCQVSVGGGGGLGLIFFFIPGKQKLKVLY